ASAAKRASAASEPAERSERRSGERVTLQGRPRGDAPRMQIDGLLLLMTVIWGTNYALVKSAFSELDPQAFNALRLVLASLVMAATSLIARPSTDSLPRGSAPRLPP